jgi:hypothetical protein
VLLQRGRGGMTLVRAMSPTLKGVLKKAQPIINRSGPKVRFRYGTLTVQKDRPVFRKGE